MNRTPKKHNITIDQIHAQEAAECNDKFRGFLNHHAVRDWYFNSEDCFGKHFDRRSEKCRLRCGVSLLCEFYKNCKDSHRKRWGF